MTTDKLQKVILEAVDCLRQRKCRPDRESIAVYVMRKFGSSMNEIFSEIENIVDQGGLLKVEYKGTTSYRSPKNFDLQNSPLLTKHSKILNSSKTTRYVISGINELLSTFPNYSKEGVPYEELKKQLLGFDKERFAEAGIKTIFEREEAAGNIQVAQCSDPLYPTRIFPKDISVPDDMKIISFVEDTSPPPETKKRKRLKKGDGEEDETSTSTSKPPKRKSKKKDDNGIVYAVKSDPDKVVVASVEEDADSAKVKAEQISSIGLKVMTRKKGKPKISPEKSNEQDVIENGTKDILLSDMKPSLALVKHEVDESTVMVKHEVDEPTESASSSNQNIVENTPISESTPAVTNNTKKKNNSSTPRKRMQAVKKTKIRTDSDSDDELTLSHIPPRYTYSAKRRYRRSYFDEKEMEEDQAYSELDNELDESLNGTSDVCAYCKKIENSDGLPEDFLCCGTCSAKIHPTCIDYSEDHAKRLRMNGRSNDSYQWQCFTCKRCGVCENALMSSKNALNTDKGKKSKKNEHRYVLCDQCDRGYHANCINRDTPACLQTDTWFCKDCKSLDLAGENDSNSSTSETKPSHKKLTNSMKKECGTVQINSVEDNPKNNGNSIVLGKPQDATSPTKLSQEKEFPDISSWTPTEVQKYFTDKGLEEEAASLREQEIDGMSLLLLRRADVIFGLNLRLGPALKIYRLVCQLQQNSLALKKKKGSIGTTSSVTKGNDNKILN